MTSKTHVAVIGAGAFGGWTALYLLRKGAHVTLIDAWGPGNARASSGGDTRILRHTYAARIYVDMAARALVLWQEHAAAWGVGLYERKGLVWMVSGDDMAERAAVLNLAAAGIDHEVLSPRDIARRFPHINPNGVDWAIYEPSAGRLLARRSCERVVQAFVEEGGEYQVATVDPARAEPRGGEMTGLSLLSGDTLTADQYVFACGPWLGRLFPEAIGNRLRATRQDMFYFGTPPAGSSYDWGKLPIWTDHSATYFYYGIPASQYRGFKIADHTHGPEFDPTDGERIPAVDALERASAALAHRFPAMAGAPLIEARVCQYEQTPDSDFIVDRHPFAANVWIVGGGSGHGFKHGPALGEHVAERVLDEKPLEPTFSLARFRQ